MDDVVHGLLTLAVVALVWLAVVARKSKGGGTKRRAVVAADQVGQPGVALTKAAAKTALRKALLQSNPRMHREVVAGIVEDFENALHERQEALSNALASTEDELRDARDDWDDEQDQGDLDELRAQLIADPHRHDREQIKAQMAEVVGRRRLHTQRIKAMEARITDPKLQAAELRKDKRAFLVEFLNHLQNGGDWYDLTPQ